MTLMNNGTNHQSVALVIQ